MAGVLADIWTDHFANISHKYYHFSQFVQFETLIVMLNLKYKYYASGLYLLSSLYFSKRNVLETGLCLYLLLKPTQLGPIGIQSLKRCVLKNKQGVVFR
jgi:hypothetical protein